MKNQFNVLLFEKDENVGSMLQEFMQMGDVSSDLFTQHEPAYEAFLRENHTVCLISLDVVQPKEEFSLAQKLKLVNKDVVLIFLASARPALDVLTKAYEIGADDFVRKPFILEELYMRIQAILKRTHGLKLQSKQVYHVGKYTFDTHKQMLCIGDECKKITTKECELLVYLCDHINSIVDRESILKNVWKDDMSHHARSMDVYITKLRRLLKGDESIAIMNIHGKGYKLLIRQS